MTGKLFCCFMAMAALLAPSPASAWEIAENPDRYPSVVYTQTALEVVNGHQDTIAVVGSTNRSLRNFSMNTLLTAILPLSGNWSLNAGGGLNFNEFETAADVGQGATVNDNSVGVYLGGLRYYFVREGAAYADAEQNPDRWNSLGLQVSGTNTIQYDATASVGGILQSLYSQSVTLSSEERFPLADWYTLVPTISGAYTRTDVGAAPTLRASTSKSKTLGGTLEQRFYLTGSNLIADDHGGNPDRWSMIYFGVSGSGTLSGTALVEPAGAGKVSATRNLDTRTFGGYLGVRLPVTEHATIKLEIDDANNNAFSSAVPADAIAGTRNRTSSLGGSASFRYYFY